MQVGLATSITRRARGQSIEVRNAIDRLKLVMIAEIAMTAPVQQAALLPLP